MSNIPRQSALAALGSLLVAPVMARAQTPVPIAVGLNTNEATVQAYFAQTAGIFEKHGLNVTLDHLAGGSVVAAAIAGGTLQVGASNALSFALEVARGLLFTAVAPGAESDTEHHLSGLVVSTAGSIHAAKDLNGKVVSGVSIGGIDHLGALAWIDQNGGDAKSINFIELPPASVPAALEQGRVAASMVAEPYLSTLLSDKIHALGNPYDAIAPKFLATLWIATPAWANANASAVRAFAQSLTEGNAWARTHNARAVALLGEWSNTTVDRLRQPMATSLDPSLLQPLLDTAYTYKFLPQAMKAADLIWNQYRPT